MGEDGHLNTVGCLTFDNALIVFEPCRENDDVSQVDQFWVSPGPHLRNSEADTVDQKATQDASDATAPLAVSFPGAANGQDNGVVYNTAFPFLGGGQVVTGGFPDRLCARLRR